MAPYIPNLARSPLFGLLRLSLPWFSAGLAEVSPKARNSSPTRRHTTIRCPLRLGFCGITTTFNLSRSRVPGSGCMDFYVRPVPEPFAMSLMHDIEVAWLRTASAAIVSHVQSYPDDMFYAGSFWLCYVDHTVFGTPCFALNTEKRSAADGDDLRWSPADWEFDCVGCTIEAMQPHYEALSQNLSGRPESDWDMAIEEHFSGLARVCRQITSAARSRHGVFRDTVLHPDFVVGIFEFREADPLFTQLIRASIAPEILATLPSPVWFP